MIFINDFVSVGFIWTEPKFSISYMIGDQQKVQWFGSQADVVAALKLQLVKKFTAETKLVDVMEIVESYAQA